MQRWLCLNENNWSLPVPINSIKLVLIASISLNFHSLILPIIVVDAQRMVEEARTDDEHKNVVVVTIFYFATAEDNLNGTASTTAGESETCI